LGDSLSVTMGTNSLVNPFQQALERFDRFQQRHTASAIAVAVFKKNGDDNGGALARQFAFSMFVATFPMLLLLVTVVGIVARQDDSIRAHILS
jgi:membrane protein